jgi:hypothetical protein
VAQCVPDQGLAALYEIDKRLLLRVSERQVAVRHEHQAVELREVLGDSIVRLMEFPSCL